MQGVESEVITTDNDGDRRRIPNVPYATTVDYEGVRVRFFPLQTNFYSASWPMLRWLRKHVSDYDLVHVHSLFNFAPGIAAYTARTAGVPYLISPHGVLEHWGRRNRRRRLKQWSLRLFEGPLLAAAAAVPFTSTSERVQAQGLPLPVRQPVIPLAVPLPDDRSNYSLGNHEAVAATQDSDDRAALPPECSDLGELKRGPWALFLARIDPKKGIERLLQAFALTAEQCPDARLVIAGSGPEPYIDSLRRRCDELGITGRVLWIGFVSGERKHWLLRHCTAFVLASDSENFGIAPIEAMASGRPVVLSSGVAVAELVQRWGAGSVTSLDPTDIAAALLRTFMDPSQADEQGRRGRAGVAAELSLHSHGQKLAQLYRSILGQGDNMSSGDAA